MSRNTWFRWFRRLSSVARKNKRIEKNKIETRKTASIVSSLFSFFAIGFLKPVVEIRKQREPFRQLLSNGFALITSISRISPNTGVALQFYLKPRKISSYRDNAAAHSVLIPRPRNLLRKNRSWKEGERRCFHPFEFSGKIEAAFRRESKSRTSLGSSREEEEGFARRKREKGWRRLKRE